MTPLLLLLSSILFLVLVVLLASLRRIGPTEVGLVTKRLSSLKLESDDPIALRGEAGYQAELLMPGLRFKLWPIFGVEKFPWVQVPAGEIGVVIAQAGAPLPIGAKSAAYKPSFGKFEDLRRFLAEGGQKGVQRPVLPPGTLAPIHPIGFLVITKKRVFGRAVARELPAGALGLEPHQLDLVRIEPRIGADGRMLDVCGVVTTFDGEPLPSGDIANRLGRFEDLAEMEASGATDSEIIEHLLASKNETHNNYQDFQAFLDRGGRIGLQHDTLLYGAYALNPFLVSVEIVPMLVVKQGEVAVVKAYTGLATQDTSGPDFKFGFVVRAGHRGIWKEPLRTGKYAINPRCYEAEIVPTAILTLNWADAYSAAHNLDRGLKQIVAKSREGFVFSIDLQVQIHVPDTKAPYVISMVGTMANLVNEVLQAAVGNHFRDKLQSMPAIDFISTRQRVQEEALAHISEQLSDYQVETRGVYIQDVILPAELVTVLTQREIANQEVETYRKQRLAEEERLEMEQAKGRANMQSQLAHSSVSVEIEANNAKAAVNRAGGEATYLEKVGTAKAAEIRAAGLARAEGYRAQVDALGAEATTLVNVASSVSNATLRLPEVYVAGNGGAMDGTLGTVMRRLLRMPSEKN